jgi:hypothetical protein
MFRMENNRTVSQSGSRSGVEQGADFVGVNDVHLKSVQQTPQAVNQTQANTWPFV